MLIHVRLVITVLPVPPNAPNYKYAVGKLSLAPGQDVHLKHAGGAWHPFQHEENMLGVLDITLVISLVLSVTQLLPHYQ